MKSAVAAHNLKAAGSNPAPATKILKDIKGLEPDVFRRVFGFPVYINATSTRHQKNRTSTHNHAVAGSGRQLAVARILASGHHRPVVPDGELTTTDSALGFLTLERHYSARQGRNYEAGRVP